jgi:hypothetical protein
MTRLYAVFIMLAAIAAGCTTVNVRPMTADHKPTYVCIRENPKVKVDDFVQVVTEGFQRHGVTTQVFSGDTPKNCEYILNYTALRSWDLTPYLSHAELRLTKDEEEVAYGEFHLEGGGGFALTKFRGTKEKMDPVIDQLFKLQ